MFLETISTFECLVSNHKIYKGFQIQRERFMDPLTSYHGIWEGKMEGCSYMNIDISILNGKSNRIFLILIISINFSYLLYHPFLFYLQKWMVMWLLLHHVIKRGVGVGEFFCFYDWMKTLMQCTFLFLKWKMPNAIFCFCFLFFQKVK